MENKKSNVLWGLVLIAAGIALAGSVLNLWRFSIFFDGWWTLFIIIPCAISIITGGANFGNIFGLLVGAALLINEQDFFHFDIFDGFWTLFIIVPCIFSIIGRGPNVGNVIGLCIGAGFLLNSLDILPFRLTWELILPVILICIGVSVMFGKRGGSGGNTVNLDKEGMLKYTAVFASHETVIQDEVFNGANIFCMFGGVDLDLRDAIIEQDVSITSTTIFGGADIFLPHDVNVKVNATPIFGGVDDNAKNRVHDESLPTVYVNCTCIFGGVDLK